MPKACRSMASLGTALALVCCTRFDDFPEEELIIARDTIRLLSKRDFAAAHANFDEASSQMTVEGLEAFWDEVTSAYGAYEGTPELVTDSENGAVFVRLKCKFAKEFATVLMIFEDSMIIHITHLTTG